MASCAALLWPGLVADAEEREESAEESLEADDFDQLYMGELLDKVVSAARHEQDIAESPSAITVISREQIENTHCTDVVCLLRQVPEVDVLLVKPLYAVVGARAFTDPSEHRVLVLIDGMEYNNEVFGIVLWQALPIHLQEIERIEVIRGPGSALYGANAHSMVVSIFTRKPAGSTADVFLGYGEHDRFSLYLGAGQHFGSWLVGLSGGLETAGHWQISGRRERDVAYLRLRLDHEGAWGATTARAGVHYSDGGITTILGTTEMRDAIFAELQVAHDNDLLHSQLALSLSDGIVPTTLDDLPYESVSYQGIKLGEIIAEIPFFSASLDAEAHVSWTFFEGNLLIAGGNYRWITMLSDVLEPAEINQHRVGLFVHDEQRLWERLVLTAGVRFDYNNITPFTVSPRVAGVVEFSDGQFLRLALGRAFRKPSFVNTSFHLKEVIPEPAFPEFGEFFVGAIGNERLGNESITTLEAGYVGRFFNASLTAEADIFYNLYRDTINFYLGMETNDFGLPDLIRSTAEYRNTGSEVDSLGGCLSLTYRAKSVFLNANYTFRRSVFTSGPEEGRRVAWEPAHLANATLQYLPERGLRVGLGWHFASSRVGQISTGGAFDPRVPIEEPASSMLSGFAGWRLNIGTTWLELGVRAFNILRVPTRDLPGRMRPDGIELGGELLGRLVFLYLRGAI